MDQLKIHNSTTIIKSYKLVSLFATNVFTETVVRLVYKPFDLYWRKNVDAR